MAHRVPTTDQRIRNPQITGEGAEMLRKLQEHPCAPRWNHVAGDRLRADDVEFLNEYRASLASRRKPFDPSIPSPAILAWVEHLRPRVKLFRDRLPVGFNFARDWHATATMSREDIAIRIDQVVPDDADLDQMIVYRTAGTTGHALLVPHAVRAAACYQLYVEFALARYRAGIDFDASMCGCFLVGAQMRTVTYPTVLSLWNQSGFAKLNINPADWPSPEAPHGYFEAFRPPLLTGDPITFAEMLQRKIPASPKAMLSTAVAMSNGLKAKLAKTYDCPVIDWYSLTETGPIGYACPAGFGYHVLPDDIFLEAITDEGIPAAPEQVGEITITGGRNPFVPLLRYRTGDFGRIEHAPCPCGDPMPRILDLEGREAVIFRAANGSVINPVDVSRVLREFPLVQHELSQSQDGACRLNIRTVGAASGALEVELEMALRAMFGDLPITVVSDPELGNRKSGGKVVPYSSEWLLED